MSDFFNSGWSILRGRPSRSSACSPAWCCWSSPAKRKVMANDNTTGHVWDEDLRELNNPLPRWWMWLFVITVVFSFAYLALYPGLGSTPRARWAGPARASGPPSSEEGAQGDGAGLRQLRRR